MEVDGKFHGSRLKNQIVWKTAQHQLVVNPVSVLILHLTEIQIMWSQIETEKAQK